MATLTQQPNTFEASDVPSFFKWEGATLFDFVFFARGDLNETGNPVNIINSSPGGFASFSFDPAISSGLQVGDTARITSPFYNVDATITAITFDLGFPLYRTNQVFTFACGGRVVDLARDYYVKFGLSGDRTADYPAAKVITIAASPTYPRQTATVRSSAFNGSITTVNLDTAYTAAAAGIAEYTDGSIDILEVDILNAVGDAAINQKKIRIVGRSDGSVDIDLRMWLKSQLGNPLTLVYDGLYEISTDNLFGYRVRFNEFGSMSTTTSGYFYTLQAVRQIQDDSLPVVTNSSMDAKFLTEFDRPRMWVGYPFGLEALNQTGNRFYNYNGTKAQVLGATDNKIIVLYLDTSLAVNNIINVSLENS